MFDIGWMELMVIGVVALIVIGPRDLPEMFRQIGRVTGKLRQMAREFSRAMEQAANESGVNEVRKDLKSLSNPVGSGIDSLKSAADRFEKWDPVKAAMKPAAPATPRTPEAPASGTAAGAATAPAAGTDAKPSAATAAT
ncbi:Sec-independent protein translocase protein TatB, partial [Albidovulum sp.]|uniref:Sec-independent protein translocase protein TatB n=1 Tax=Albidovulum sp. TaxID=1872424 RepID=UPI0039B920DA